MKRLLIAMVIALASAAGAQADCTVYHRVHTETVTSIDRGQSHYVHVACDNPRDILLSCVNEPTPCADSAKDSVPRGGEKCDASPYDCIYLSGQHVSYLSGTQAIGPSCTYSHYIYDGSGHTSLGISLEIYPVTYEIDAHDAPPRPYCRRIYSFPVNDLPHPIPPNEAIVVAVGVQCIAVP